MADNKKNQTIIIKRIKKGGHGHHGGAWKVAYADFVTAMMAFFLVMWLLGSDEEIKAAIANYFNNPVSAYRPDISSKDMVPLGDKTGAGDDVLNGADGNLPEELIDHPSKQFVVNPEQGQESGEPQDHSLPDQALMSVDLVKFSVPIDLLFENGSTENWTPAADQVLNRLGKMARKYNGQLKIETPTTTKSENYEFQLSRAVSISKFLVERNYAAEERISVSVAKGARNLASSDDQPRKVEFTLIKSH